MLVCDLGGDESTDALVDFDLVQIDRRDAMVLGEDPGEVQLADGSEFDQVVPNTHARLSGILSGLVELFPGHESLLDEQVPNPVL